MIELFDANMRMENRQSSIKLTTQVMKGLQNT